MKEEKKKLRYRIGSDPHKPYLKKKGSKYKRIEMREDLGIGGRTSTRTHKRQSK